MINNKAHLPALARGLATKGHLPASEAHLPTLDKIYFCCMLHSIQQRRQQEQ